MPPAIIFMLASAPVLLLALLTDLSPDAQAALRLALGVWLLSIVAWLTLELVRGLRDSWRRFLSRPY